MHGGFNTNIQYKDRTFHVQTEDGGLHQPVIVTLLYFKGAILANKKFDYRAIVNTPDQRKKIELLMMKQHNGMIRELKAEKYADIIAPYLEADVQAAELKASADGEQPMPPATPATPTTPAEPADKPTNQTDSINLKARVRGLEEKMAENEGGEEGKGEDGDKVNAGEKRPGDKDKKQLIRSLDDVLLDYIMKRKGN